MFRGLLAALGIRSMVSRAVTPSSGSFAPYGNSAFNVIYNLLFCDDIELFRAGKQEEAQGPWMTLLAENPDAAALREIAEDPSQESRLRVFAYNGLREKKEPVPAKELLGVIVEVGLEEGLDVLAAFADGSLRYINHAEKMSVFEKAPPDIEAKIKRLLAVSQPVVSQIGPWERARLSPPAKGVIRMTFLVSDGLYFGQGPFHQMQEDPMAGPVIAASLDLLQAVADKTAGQQEIPDKNIQPPC